MTDIPRGDTVRSEGTPDPDGPYPPMSAQAGPDGKDRDGIRPVPGGPELLDDSPQPARGAVAGPDGRLRCPWGLSAPEYVAYHDDEWGRQVHGDQPIFERLCLEAFQSGLSWLTILRKRENFRKAFAGFDIEAVAAFTDTDVARLLEDAGIVRNRAKINAAITNARAALAVTEGLSDLVWSYAETGPRPAPRTLADLPAQTVASKALAKELRKRGFAFTGPVTVYAAMQACGLVNDHLEACFARTR